MDPHILVVEDDPVTLRSLIALLEGADYRVTPARDGEAALALLASQTFDIVLTDIRMRAVNGIAVLDAARAQTYEPAVILLTGYGTLDTALAALRGGAANYLLKPCAPTELLACVSDAFHKRDIEQRRSRAVGMVSDMLSVFKDVMPDVERPPAAPAPASTTEEETERYIRIGRLCIDSYRHTATFDDIELHLTPIEYVLLRCLAKSPGRVFTHQEIVRSTHGQHLDNSEALKLLKPHIRNLRRKVDPAYLISKRGIGYRLVDPQDGSFQSDDD
jgi:DNA-binding response OmpR family regulator